MTKDELSKLSRIVDDARSLLGRITTAEEQASRLEECLPLAVSVALGKTYDGRLEKFITLRVSPEAETRIRQLLLDEAKEEAKRLRGEFARIGEESI